MLLDSPVNFIPSSQVGNAVSQIETAHVYRGDGLNLYAYCKNNPVVYYDPSGFGKLKPVTSDNPDIIELMQRTTQRFAGKKGQVVGAVPTKEYFREWFDSLSHTQLEFLVREPNVYRTIGSNGRLRLGDRHEFFKISQMVKLKQLGFTASEISNFSTLTIETQFVNIDMGDGNTGSSLHFSINDKNKHKYEILVKNNILHDSSVSSRAHKQLDDIIEGADSKQELLDEMLPWIDKHFKRVQIKNGELTFIEGRAGTPMEVLGNMGSDPAPSSNCPEK